MGVISLGVSLFARDLWSAIASLGICTGAAIEVLGAGRAARHDASATRFLVASQLISMASVLALILRCSVAFSPAAAVAWLPASTREAIQLIFPDPGEADAFLRLGVRVALGCTAIVVTLYEGGMAAYYGSSGHTFDRLSGHRSRER